MNSNNHDPHAKLVAKDIERVLEAIKQPCGDCGQDKPIAGYLTNGLSVCAECAEKYPVIHG